MLIGLLIAYLFLGGSHQTFLLNPAMEKNVNTFVKDKSRKEQIDLLIKQTVKSEENFQKKIEKPAGKKLEDLNMNLKSQRSQFSAEYNILYDSLESLQGQYLKSELKIRSLIHPNEWDSIMNQVLKAPARDKIKKSLLGENKKLHDHLLRTCNDHITDSTNRKKAKSLIDEYMVKGNTLADAFLDLSYKYMTSIRPYTASEDAFQQPREKMIGLRKDYSNFLVDLRFNLMSLTAPKEWPAVAKELNNDFNYMGAGAKR